MTDMNDNSLQQSWQSEAPVDITKVANRLEAVNREHRLFNRLAFLAGWALTLALATAEFNAAVPTDGWLAGTAAAFMLLATLWHARARRILQRRYASEPAAMLDFTIGRVRAGLWLARTLYIVVPLAALGGYIAGKVIAHASAPAAPTGAALFPIVAIGLLIPILIISGLRLAGRRAREMRALSAARRDMEDRM